MAGTASRAAGRTASEVGGKAAADVVAGGLGFWETMGVTFAVSLLFDAAIGWMTYEKNVGDPKALKFAGFLHDKLNLALMQGIQAHVNEARRMAIDRPDLPVYAILTYDLDYHWTGESSGAVAFPGQDLDYRDARVVTVQLGRQQVSTDVVLSRAGAGDLRRRTDTRRITISLELNPVGETAQMRHWRVLLRDAGQAASRGLSARSVVEHSHLDIQLTPAEEREERSRARVGLASVRDERERQEQLMWVAAYLDYTLIHGPQNLYDDAVAYHRELERRPLPSKFPPPSSAARFDLAGAGPRGWSGTD
jgi:hypothetical protein